MVAYRLCLFILTALALVSIAAPPASAQVSTEQALAPFQQFLQGLVAWMLGPGRLIIAGAWILAGFRVVLGMDRGIRMTLVGAKRALLIDVRKLLQNLDSSTRINIEFFAGSTR